MIYSEAVPAEYMKEYPLCMNQYKNIFGISRLPGEKADTLSTVFPATARHIVVMINDSMYKVDVIHSDGTYGTAKEIREYDFVLFYIDFINYSFQITQRRSKTK
jgi:hypothetical protein